MKVACNNGRHRDIIITYKMKDVWLSVILLQDETDEWASIVFFALKWMTDILIYQH